MLQNTGSGSSELGTESWAFMPRALMKNVATLKNNVVGIAHPVGLDGQPAVLTKPGPDGVSITGTGSKAWVFFGLRRGGGAYYALDVTDPDNPKLKWYVDSATPGFQELTLSFSTPTIGVLQYGVTAKEVVMFGGGYFGGGSGTTGRTGYDVYGGAAVLTDGGGASIVKGNAVYIVDADTGALIWKAAKTTMGAGLPAGAVEEVNSGLDHSIAAQITLADTNGDDIDDRAYVGDLGGNIWRVDLPRSSTTDVRGTWQIAKLAALGNGAAGGSGDRRFMDRVDFVPSQYPGSSTAFDALMIGSGDREHPTETTVDNQFYMLKDPNGYTPPDPSGTPVAPSGLADANCFLDFDGFTPPLSCGVANATANTQLATGWALDMEAPGEKVLAPSVSVNNEVFFTSYLPEGEPGAGGSPDPCNAGTEGSGRFYAVSLFNGYPVLNQQTLDDLGNQDASSKVDRYSPLKSKGIPSEIVPLGPGYFIRPDLSIGKTSGSSMFRTFWFEKGVD
jgi:type IV pilus assembly protein PilY1